MALLTPIGIYLPQMLGAGDAWGEWGTDTIKELIGYVPAGLQRLADIWKAPVPDYSLGGESASMGIKALSYILSALIGFAAVAAAVFIIARLVRRNGK